MVLNFILINGVSFIFFILSQMAFAGRVSAYLPYLLITLSFPHFILTYWIWIKRVESWKNEKWPLLFPLIYLNLFITSSMYPLEWLNPQILVKLSYYYLLYHFAQQMYGVTLWMSHSYGVAVDRWTRYTLRAFFLLSASYAMFDLELREATNVLFYLTTPVWRFPSELLITNFALVGALFVILIGLILKNFYQQKNIRAFMPLAGVSVSTLWFIPPFSHGMIFFLPIIHSLQYFPFIYMKNRGLTLYRWMMTGALAVFAGWVFFRGIPFMVPTGWPLWPAMVLTLLNNHHFIIDGRIWKLRDVKNRDLFSAEVPGSGQYSGSNN